MNDGTACSVHRQTVERERKHTKTTHDARDSQPCLVRYPYSMGANVPNALMSIGMLPPPFLSLNPDSKFYPLKLTCVPRARRQILIYLPDPPAPLQHTPAADDVQLARAARLIDAGYASIDGLHLDILTDFFRYAFDGSGADNYTGSCIDGRFTSA